MSLRELISEAQSRLSLYRHPDVSEVSEQLSQILEVLGRGSLKYDRITHIEEEDGVLRVNTTYSLRSCENSGEYEIPIEIVDAADPLQAASRWLKQQELDETVKDLESTTATLRDLPDCALRLKARIERLEQEVAQRQKELT